MPFYRRDNRRGGSIAMFFLLNEILRNLNDTGIPPVTLTTIIAQVLLYLRIFRVPWRSVWDVCISVDRMKLTKDWKRMVFSTFEHADDWHLYYNMISFLSKGKDLEKRFGTWYFISLLVVFTFCTNLTYLGLNVLLSEITDDYTWRQSCAIGFSGVIFALKVLTTHYWPREQTSVYGLQIGSKYVVWFELVLIQLLTPGVSFVGHLSGILVGLAYIYGPLKILLDSLVNFFAYITSNADRSQRSTRNDYYYDDDEQIRRAMNENYRENFSRFQEQSRPYPSAPPAPDNTQPPYPSSSPFPDIEMLRQRRAERFTFRR